MSARGPPGPFEVTHKTGMTDFEALLEISGREQVRFIVVGGAATISMHAIPGIWLVWSQPWLTSNLTSAERRQDYRSNGIRQPFHAASISL